MEKSGYTSKQSKISRVTKSTKSKTKNKNTQGSTVSQSTPDIRSIHVSNEVTIFEPIIPIIDLCSSDSNSYD